LFAQEWGMFAEDNCSFADQENFESLCIKYGVQISANIWVLPKDPSSSRRASVSTCLYVESNENYF
jgi:hypothetical protein